MTVDRCEVQTGVAARTTAVEVGVHVNGRLAVLAGQRPALAKVFGERALSDTAQTARMTHHQTTLITRLSRPPIALEPTIRLTFDGSAFERKSHVFS
ncbi:MAG: hypothetical protein ACKVG5_11445 [Acidimicrobiales bacterium]